MTHLKRRTAVIGVLVALGALAVFVAMRGMPSRGIGSSETRSPPPAPGLLSEDDIVFEVQPTEETVTDITQRAADQARSLLSELPESLAIRHNRAGFLKLLRKRVEMLIDPDFDEWIEHVMAFDGEPTGPASSSQPSLVVYDPSDPNPAFREKWERVASGFRLTPMSIQGMRVRPVRVAGEDVLASTQTGRRFYPIFRGGYHDDPEDQISPRYTDVYEIVIPMLYQQTRSTDHEQIHDIKAQMGIRLAWDSSRRRWIPYALVGYDSAGSATLPPVF